MYTVENLHPAVIADIKTAAQAELDRIWDLLTKANNVHELSIGKMGEKMTYDYAMEIHAQYEATKSAYKALGLTGSIGIHRI
jgi:hypothetical protein